MNYEDNPKSIKYYVKQFILNKKDNLAGKRIVDFPAGNGVSSRILKDVGAVPIPFDLFPEYFNIDGIDCRRANISNGIPLADAEADGVICQEGIEHFSDQLGAFKEFNRITKTGGLLLVTTPNYSNLRAKVSYLLSESERFVSIMPPNELDSIWMSKHDVTDEIYYGHIFLVGIQKLRVFGQLAGFKIKEVHFTRAKSTSTLLLPFLYPFIYLSNWVAYRKNLRKNNNFPKETVKQVYKEIFKLSTNVKILVSGDLMVEFEKIKELEDVGKSLKSQHKDFGLT